MKKSYYIRTKDYFLSQEDFFLYLNERKDILQTFPIPDDIEGYYNAPVYTSHNDNASDIQGFIYLIVKNLMLRKKIHLLSKIKSSLTTILDIGSGTGAFVLKASQKGWKAKGVEPNDNARKRSLKKDIEITKTYPNDTFDVITMWHVLEHIVDIEKEIKKIKLRLNVNGHLIIAVPNYKSYDAKYYRGYWAAYDVPRHLWHFSREGLICMIEKLGLSYIGTKPLFFDALYISILSEKYKKNKFPFIRGFFIGLYSNLRAFITKEFSSNIFIFKIG